MTNRKKLVLLSLSLSLVIITLLYVFFSESAELKLIANELNSANSNITITLCENYEVDVNNFKKIFFNRRQMKLAGSHPIGFYKLHISINVKEYKYFLGQDSRNPNTFWIYPFNKPDKFIRQLGFIDSKVIRQISGKIDCEKESGGWIRDSFKYL